jgi:hypothetical protein
MSKLTSPKAETWDKVSENYNVIISEHEKEYADEILKVLKSLDIPSNASLIELGSGCGHLSGLLNKEGYEVTLLDFSNRALDKSKEFFKAHNLKGEFINGDIFDLSNIEPVYDVLWNSGVMEHFDDNSLYKTFRAIRNKTKKYFIFTVPNAHSLPYFLYRYQLMKKNEWIYGTEYLRTDYVRVLNLAGFSVEKIIPIGWTSSYGMLESTFKGSSGLKYYKELIDNNLVQENNSALAFYICVVDENVKNFSDKIVIGDTVEKTTRFDTIAGYSEENYIPKKSLKLYMKSIIRPVKNWFYKKF